MPLGRVWALVFEQAQRPCAMLTDADSSPRAARVRRAAPAHPLASSRTSTSASAAVRQSPRAWRPGRSEGHVPRSVLLSHRRLGRQGFAQSEARSSPLRSGAGANWWCRPAASRRGALAGLLGLWLGSNLAAGSLPLARGGGLRRRAQAGGTRCATAGSAGKRRRGGAGCQGRYISRSDGHKGPRSTSDSGPVKPGPASQAAPIHPRRRRHCRCHTPRAGTPKHDSNQATPVVPSPVQRHAHHTPPSMLITTAGEK